MIPEISSGLTFPPYPPLKNDNMEEHRVTQCSLSLPPFPFVRDVKVKGVGRRCANQNLKWCQCGAVFPQLGE